MKIITAKERRRRDAANERWRLKRVRARRKGICRCGQPLARNQKTGKLKSACTPCLKKSCENAKRYYAKGPKPPYDVNAVKLDGRLKDSTGVYRRLERDGLGREDWWWICSITRDKKTRSRRFSVHKHGDLAANRMARGQRAEWELRYPRVYA